MRDNLFKLLSLCSSMKKELGFVFILFFSVVFVLAYSSSIPNPGHGADEIFVYINGKVLSLQSAIDSSEFNRNSYSGGGVSSNIVFGHGDVYVNVGGVNKNLQSAINDNSLCLFDGGAGVYSGVESVGHSADKILVNFNGERSLQATINQGLFAGKWDKVASDVCNGQSFTRSRCGISEAGTGTKTTGECAVCVVSSWTPATNTYCSGTSFTQTSNCDTTRSATGIKTTGECATYSCTGSIISNAERYDSEEETSLTSNVAWAYSASDTSKKCQYKCSSGYVRSGSSCVVDCTSHSTSACYGGDVYWYDSCGARETKKKDCTLSYSRGGCWNGYCVRKMTRHTSSKYEDHMVSPCGLLNVCETSFFSDYGPAEIAFYLLNDEDYPSSLRIALYRKSKEYSSVDMDHLVTTNSAEASDYNLEGLLGYALRYGEAGTSPLYRMRLNAGGGHDHMVSFSTTEGSPRYVYEGPLGHVITSRVSV